MSNQQHPKQQNRPSLYETRGTTSAFSILRAAQPLGWSKQKSIGLSIISFIAGGVFSGGAVGLMKSTEQPASQLPELANSKPAYEMPKNIPVSTLKPAAFLPVTDQAADIQLNKSVPITNQPVAKNPLASFKNDAVQKNLASKPTIQKSHHSNEMTTKDDTDLQKLIERKTQHGEVAAKTNATNDKVDRKQIEENKIAADALTQKSKTKQEQSSPTAHVAVRPKKPLTHDKDVLLVKSMLDTMDHPLTVDITTRAKPADGGN